MSTDKKLWRNRPDRDSQPVRRFECFTAELHRLADWLQSCGVKAVALQSTGVYWIPLYDKVVHPHAAGIAVGNGLHYVAVRPDRDPQPVRWFECFTADLHRLTDWLQRCGVKAVADLTPEEG